MHAESKGVSKLLGLNVSDCIVVHWMLWLLKYKSIVSTDAKEQHCFACSLVDAIGPEIT